MSAAPLSTWLSALVLVALGAGAACAPAIEVQRVSPRQVVEASGAVVQVTGEGFQYTFNTFTGEATAEFGVRIGTTMAPVEWVDATELAVTVPEGLVPGSYDLEVTWDGATDVLEEGLRVVAAATSP